MKVHLIRHRQQPGRRGIVIGLTEKDVEVMRDHDGVMAVEGVPDLGGRHEIYVFVGRNEDAVASFLADIDKGGPQAAVN